MLGITIRAIRSAGIIIPLFCASTRAQEGASPAFATEIVISAADQQLALLRDGMVLAKYKISTSKFGVGDRHGSFKTPLGKLRVAEKIGGSLKTGAVIKHRNPTGEVLPVNSPGRDPIVTRIIWLEGCEEQNKNAKGRGIYIHGTVEESKLGRAVSYGCIRMSSTDVVDVFAQVPIGTPVSIREGRLSRYRKWSPPAPVIIAAKKSEPVVKRATAATPESVKIAATTSRTHKAETPEPATTSRKTPKRTADRRKKTEDIAAATAPTPSDPGAVAALEGSILFKGLSDKAPEGSIVKGKSPPQTVPAADDPPAKAVPEPPVAFRTQGAASLRNLDRRRR